MGLVTQWLKQKKQQGITSLSMFDDSSDPLPSENTPLLTSSQSFTSHGSMEHSLYRTGSHGSDLTSISHTLAGVGLTHSVGQSTKADRSFRDDALAIGERVCAQDARFYILGFRGGGNHAIGIVREESVSSFPTVRVFDPNEGEFEVSGAVGILAMLVWLKTISYPKKYDAEYALYAFAE